MEYFERRILSFKRNKIKYSLESLIRSNSRLKLSAREIILNNLIIRMFHVREFKISFPSTTRSLRVIVRRLFRPNTFDICLVTLTRVKNYIINFFVVNPFSSVTFITENEIKISILNSTLVYINRP